VDRNYAADHVDLLLKFLCHVIIILRHGISVIYMIQSTSGEHVSTQSDTPVLLRGVFLL